MPPPNARRGTRLFAAVAAIAMSMLAVLAGGAAVADTSGDDLTKGLPVVEPSAEELRKQEQQATKLAKAAKAKVASSEEARGRLDELAEKAGVHLEAYAKAGAEAQQARAQEQQEQARHDAAVAEVRELRATLGRLASAAYRHGATPGQMGLLHSLLSGKSVTDAGRMVADVKWAGAQQGHELERMRTAQLVIAQSAAAASAAAERAVAAEARARDAHDKAQALVAEQDALVVILDNEAAKALDDAAAAKTKAKQMEKAKLVAALYRAEAERQRREALGRGEVVQVLVDSNCPGGDVSDSPNGQIDRALLCSLWGAEWHILRADAAATFNRMSKAYAENFGRPICVTDSYRSLEAQIDVHKRKPDMTALPGTSNHGWGMAVDLCDGIENFGSESFRWMKLNASRYYWYHPSWAAEGGSRPEPWHWEFAG